jgi:uncharacterized delta-60 repeat protein
MNLHGGGPRVEPMERRWLLSAGMLDPFFGNRGVVTTNVPGGQCHIYDLTSIPDGRILAVGEYESSAGEKLVLARYRPNGKLDTSFGGGGSAPSGAVITDVPATDGGEIRWLNSGKFLFLSSSRLIRFDADGSIDPSFTQDAFTRFEYDFVASSLDVQRDGKIVLAGRYRAMAGKAGHFAVARLNAKGTRDRSFGTGGVSDFFPTTNGDAHAVRAMPDGSILASGVNNFGYPTDNDEYTVDECVALKLKNDGSIDASYGATGIAKQQFRYFAGGRFTSAIAATGATYLAGYDYADDKVAMCRFTPAGTRDSTWGTNGRISADHASDLRLATQRDGSLVTMMGGFTGFSPTPRVDTLRRYKPDGKIDTSFGAQGTANLGIDADNVVMGSVHCAVDGSILVPFDSDDSHALQIARLWRDNAPAAQATAGKVNRPGTTPQRIIVTIRDDVAVDVDSINASDFRIISPDGRSLRASMLSLDTTGGPTKVKATLQLAAPGGAWDTNDNGAYRIRLLPNRIADQAGHLTNGGMSGTFWVRVPTA